MADEASNVFGEVADYCRRAEPSVDRELYDMLWALAKFCDVLNVLLKFAGSWERVIYLLRSFSRAAGGCAHAVVDGCVGSYIICRCCILL